MKRAGESANPGASFQNVALWIKNMIHGYSAKSWTRTIKKPAIWELHQISLEPWAGRHQSTRVELLKKYDYCEVLADIAARWISMISVHQEGQEWNAPAIRKLITQAGQLAGISSFIEGLKIQATILEQNFSDKSEPIRRAVKGQAAVIVRAAAEAVAAVPVPA